jgi:hypothetical protein
MRAHARVWRREAGKQLRERVRGREREGRRERTVVAAFVASLEKRFGSNEKIRVFQGFRGDGEEEKTDDKEDREERKETLNKVLCLFCLLLK